MRFIQHIYLSMSAYSTFIGLKGFANWFMVQYQEEIMRAMKIYDYINDQGGGVKLTAIAQPPTEFGSPLNMFKKTLEHENLRHVCLRLQRRLRRAKYKNRETIKREVNV